MSIGDKEIVIGDPILFGERAPEGLLRFFRRPGFDVTPPVTDAMDMHIDTDSRLLKSNGDDQICGLSSDPREGHELINGIRYHSPICIYQPAANLMNGFGLRSVESNWVNRPLDLFEGQFQQGCRVARHGEQPITGFPGSFVFGAKAQETGDENQKRISVGLLGDDSKDRFLPPAHLFPDQLDSPVDLIPPHQACKRAKERMRPKGITKTARIYLFRSPLGEPLLSTSLCFALFGLLPDAGLLIETTAL